MNQMAHEGYLRGILGEVRQLLSRRPGEFINPKWTLRIIKGILYAKKTIFGVDEVNAWDVLKRLRQMEPGRGTQFDTLETSLSFFETFRYLYQLYVVQEEEIPVEGEEAREALRTVANVMGYVDVGAVDSSQHLLVHYYEHADRVRDVVRVLLEDLRTHLGKVTMFLKPSVAEGEKRGNLALALIDLAQFYRGSAFFDDFLTQLSASGGKMLETFVRDFDALGERKREETIGRYAAWTNYDLLSVMSLLVTLGDGGRDTRGYELFCEMNRKLMDELKGFPSALRRLCEVFRVKPELMNDYLKLLSREEIEGLKIIVEKCYVDEVYTFEVERLGKLIDLYLLSSRYFMRFFDEVTKTCTHCLYEINSPETLEIRARGVYSDVERLTSFKEKRDRLGQFYDLEFLRVGLLTLGNVPVQDTNLEFTTFADTYFTTLFDICKQEVDREYGRRVLTRDLLAVFAAGGHARSQAYDDDYDIIVLLDSEDEEVIEYSNKVISKMNADIIKRGTLPHYRLAERFGKYVVLMDELVELLESDDPDVFIEKSQILGSRLVVGSQKFEEKMHERVIGPLIMGQHEEYTRCVIEEIRSRHEDEGIDDLDLKEARGGLRDIELVALMYKAKYRVHQPISGRIFVQFEAMDPDHETEIRALRRGFNFLRNLRDVFRLSVAASDLIERDHLARPAEIMGFESTDELLEMYIKALKESREAVETITREILP
jgi:hypothetical protein